MVEPDLVGRMNDNSNSVELMVDVLCLGIACYDLIFSVDRHVGADEKMKASELTSCGGGPAANAAMTVARLGYSVAFAGYLGRDMYGDKHLDELRAAGVNTELVARGEWPTSLSAILVKPDGARALVNYGLGQDMPGEVEFPLEDCCPRAVLVDGHYLAAAEPLIARARTAGIPTVLDGDTLHLGSKTLMEMVEFLVVSEHFAREYSRQDDVADALTQLKSLRAFDYHYPRRTGGCAGTTGPTAASAPARAATRPSPSKQRTQPAPATPSTARSPPALRAAWGGKNCFVSLLRWARFAAPGKAPVSAYPPARRSPRFWPAID